MPNQYREVLRGVKYPEISMVLKVRNSLQNVTVGVEYLWPTDVTRGVPVRVQDYLRVNETPRENALVESLAQSGSSWQG